jgi:hypothetical protein
MPDDLQSLEAENLSRGGIPPAADSTSLPDQFQAILAPLAAGSAARSTERLKHISIARRLLDQLDSADNQVVKAQKRRILRAELNALRLLEGP